MGEKAIHPKENGVSNENNNLDEEMEEDEDEDTEFGDMAVEGNIQIYNLNQITEVQSYQ